jgi:hypothetical protein
MARHLHSEVHTARDGFCLIPRIFRLCRRGKNVNEPKPYSAQNPAFSASTPKPTDPVAFVSPAKPAADASSDKKDGADAPTEKKVTALIAEKAGVVAKKVTQVVGQTADRLSDGRDRLVSASRRSPQGAALTMLGVGIGTGIGCGILISSLYSKNRRKNRADSPLAG